MNEIDLTKRYNKIRKIGNLPNLYISGGGRDIWDFLNSQHRVEYVPYVNGDQPQGVDIYISSSNVADDQILLIYGLDGNGLWKVTEKQLAGQTKTLINDQLFRIFYVKILGSIAPAGNIYIYRDITVTNGVPDNPTFVLAYVTNGKFETNMIHFTVPWNMRGWVSRFEINLLESEWIFQYEEITTPVIGYQSNQIKGIQFFITRRKAGGEFEGGGSWVLNHPWQNRMEKVYDINGIDKEYDFPLFPGDDIVIRTISYNYADASISFELILGLARL